MFATTWSKTKTLATCWLSITRAGGFIWFIAPDLLKLKVYQALQLNLRNEFIVENEIREYRHADHEQCRASEEQNTHIRFLGFLGNEGLKARYHRVLAMYLSALHPRGTGR